MQIHTKKNLARSTLNEISSMCPCRSPLRCAPACSVPWETDLNECHQWVALPSSQCWAPARGQRNGGEWDWSIYAPSFHLWSLQNWPQPSTKGPAPFKVPHSLLTRFGFLGLKVRKTSPGCCVMLCGFPSHDFTYCLSIKKTPQIILVRMCHLFPPKTKPKLVTVVNWAGEWGKRGMNTSIWSLEVYSDFSLFSNDVLCVCFLQ